MSLSNNSTPSQSVEIVDPEGSCKKDNYATVFSIDEIEIIHVSKYWTADGFHVVQDVNNKWTVAYRYQVIDDCKPIKERLV